MSKSVKVIATALVGLLISMGYFYFDWHSDTRISYLFYIALGEANKKTLDLRNFNDLDWDELTFWAPYGNICDLGIEDYEKGGSNCQFSVDDGESYLIFLNRNKLAHKIALNRKRLDLAASQIKWRIKKSDAVFNFVSQGDWPRVRLEVDKNTLDPSTEISLEDFHNINDPRLSPYLRTLKRNQITEGLVLSDGRRIIANHTFLGLNRPLGIYIFKKEDKILAIVTKPHVDLPICEEPLNETTDIAGEVHTYKESLDYPVFVTCPKLEWLKDLE